ncbi:aldehyde dehydrogenase family protein [Skermania piniformis]|uniref:Aldehyde dehydrogenase family protein n=1 Tax=Skermania pinensis TaxID=39122 RepID=A0ABX8SD59_9ACTN|nr:aldehyde dehydrogenase family protein [Skermania piniformis]QXQ14540.1 aldehyde dehydrogenase family protein [Skermania piniformis]
MSDSVSGESDVAAESVEQVSSEVPAGSDAKVELEKSAAEVPLDPAGTRVLSISDPRTGESVGTYAVMGSADVARILLEARSAARWWTGLEVADRKRWLLAWKRAIARRADDLAAVIAEETGKPGNDALIEVMLAVEHLDWAARHAGKVLGSHRISTAPLARHLSGTVRYVPYGVVGVLGSWAYPLLGPMSSIAYAMAAGNAVVLKPHELTPGVGVWLAESWRRVVPDQPVLAVLTGDESTGQALCRGRVDKISFTGSAAGARAVLAVCAQNLTPVLVQGGGNDAMVVGVDARVDTAAEAAVFGGMTNAGQARAAIERVYVPDSIFDSFVAEVAARVRRLRPGPDRDASYGPMTDPAQLDVVRRQVRDALAKGGTAVVGGLDSFREPYIEPIVLTDVPEDAAIMIEETCAPVLVINRIATDEGSFRGVLSHLNAGSYGLGAAIYARDVKEALANAERMRVGVVCVNTVLGFIALPELPFGGVGESGYGRTHGAEGLREFSWALSIVRGRRAPGLRLQTFDRPPRHMRLVRAVFRLRHTRRRGEEPSPPVS